MATFSGRQRRGMGRSATPEIRIGTTSRSRSPSGSVGFTAQPKGSIWGMDTSASKAVNIQSLDDVMNEPNKHQRKPQIPQQRNRSNSRGRSISRSKSPNMRVQPELCSESSPTASVCSFEAAEAAAAASVEEPTVTKKRTFRIGPPAPTKAMLLRQKASAERIVRKQREDALQSGIITQEKPRRVKKQPQKQPTKHEIISVMTPGSGRLTKPSLTVRSSSQPISPPTLLPRKVSFQIDNNITPTRSNQVGSPSMSPERPETAVPTSALAGLFDKLEAAEANVENNYLTKFDSDMREVLQKYASSPPDAVDDPVFSQINYVHQKEVIEENYPPKFFGSDKKLDSPSVAVHNNNSRLVSQQQIHSSEIPVQDYRQNPNHDTQGVNQLREITHTEGLQQSNIVIPQLSQREDSQLINTMQHRYPRGDSQKSDPVVTLSQSAEVVNRQQPSSVDDMNLIKQRNPATEVIQNIRNVTQDSRLRTPTVSRMGAAPSMKPVIQTPTVSVVQQQVPTERPAALSDRVQMIMNRLQQKKTSKIKQPIELPPEPEPEDILNDSQIEKYPHVAAALGVTSPVKEEIDDNNTSVLGILQQFKKKSETIRLSLLQASRDVTSEREDLEYKEDENYDNKIAALEGIIEASPRRVRPQTGSWDESPGSVSATPTSMTATPTGRTSEIKSPTRSASVQTDKLKIKKSVPPRDPSPPPPSQQRKPAVPILSNNKIKKRVDYNVQVTPERPGKVSAQIQRVKGQQDKLGQDKRPWRSISNSPSRTNCVTYPADDLLPGYPTRSISPNAVDELVRGSSPDISHISINKQHNKTISTASISSTQHQDEDQVELNRHISSTTTLGGDAIRDLQKIAANTKELVTKHSNQISLGTSNVKHSLNEKYEHEHELMKVSSPLKISQKKHSETGAVSAAIQRENSIKDKRPGSQSQIEVSEQSDLQRLAACSEVGDEVRLPEQDLTETICAIAVQSIWRGHFARKMVSQMKIAAKSKPTYQCALRIQKVWKGFKARKAFKRKQQQETELTNTMNMLIQSVKQAGKLTHAESDYITSFISSTPALQTPRIKKKYQGLFRALESRDSRFCYQPRESVSRGHFSHVSTQQIPQDIDVIADTQISKDSYWDKTVGSLESDINNALTQALDLTEDWGPTSAKHTDPTTLLDGHQEELSLIGVDEYQRPKEVVNMLKNGKQRTTSPPSLESNSFDIRTDALIDDFDATIRGLESTQKQTSQTTFQKPQQQLVVGGPRRDIKPVTTKIDDGEFSINQIPNPGLESAGEPSKPPPLSFRTRTIPTSLSSSTILSAALVLHLTHHWPEARMVAEFTKLSKSNNSKISFSEHDD